MDKIIDSLYLHFPFCTHLCNYCDFYKKVPGDKKLDFDSFHKYLNAAFIEHQNLMDLHGYSWRPLKTFYIGGGTPSFWGKEGKIFLDAFLSRSKISLATDCEFTLEVNPGAWTSDGLKAWQDLGVNRFSLGIQTLNPSLLKFLDRSHPYEEINRTLEFFAKDNLNFSMDFMLGLPYSDSSQRNVIAELSEALVYRPKHFSVYILTVKENYKYYDQLPNEEWIEKEFLDVANFLKSKNYKHYEVSNFALENKKSRHNLNYWESKTVAALGPSATGFLAEDLLRYKWKTNSPTFEIEELNLSQAFLEKIYMALRSDIGIDKSAFNQKNDQFSLLLKRWKLSELVTEEKSRIYLTSKGYLLLDSLMDDLFKCKLLE